VERIGKHRDMWTLNMTAPNQRNSTNRFSGRELWWDVAENPRVPGQWQDYGIWECQDRAGFLVKELKEIRLVLMGTLGERVKKKGMYLLMLCVDNWCPSYTLLACAEPNP
jgi:hypothetical protein